LLLSAAERHGDVPPIIRDFRPGRNAMLRQAPTETRRGVGSGAVAVSADPAQNQGNRNVFALSNQDANHMPVPAVGQWRRCAPKTAAVPRTPAQKSDGRARRRGRADGRRRPR
jgi:hypothetical protein